jgi:hypothetical protein
LVALTQTLHLVVEGWAPNVIKKVGEVVSNFFENFLLPLLQVAFAGPSAASDSGEGSFLEQSAFEASSAQENKPKAKSSNKKSKSNKQGDDKQDDRNNAPDRPGSLAIFVAKDILKSSSVLVDEIADRMAALLRLDLHDNIIDTTRAPLSQAISSSVSESLERVLPVTLSRTVPIMIEKLTPVLLLRQVSASITELVTRGVVHALVPTLVHLLQPSEHWDTLLHHAHTDAAMYSDYYVDYFITNPFNTSTLPKVNDSMSDGP